MIKFLGGDVLSQQNLTQKRKRKRKYKTERSREKLIRWMANRIDFHSCKGVASLNQTEAARDLKWHRSTVSSHWKCAMRHLSISKPYYVFRLVYGKSRCSKSHRQSKNKKLIWYGIDKRVSGPDNELYETTKNGENRYLKNIDGLKIQGRLPLSENGGIIGGVSKRNAQKHLRPCQASSHAAQAVRQKLLKTVWKLDRKLRNLNKEAWKVRLFPEHTHSLARASIQKGFSMEGVIEMAKKNLKKWHAIASDNHATHKSQWDSTGWLSDCYKDLEKCHRFEPKKSKSKNKLSKFRNCDDLKNLSCGEIRRKMLESLNSKNDEDSLTKNLKTKNEFSSHQILKEIAVKNMDIDLPQESWEQKRNTFLRELLEKNDPQKSFEENWRKRVLIKKLLF